VSGTALVGPPTHTGRPAVVETGGRRQTWGLLAGGVVITAAMIAGVLVLRHPAPAPVVMPQMMPTAAHVHVETTPPGALIEWNGRPLDRTPADLTLEPGTQTLVVSRDGYDTEMFSIDVKAGDTLTRSMDLHAKPAPPPPPATTAMAVPAAPPARPVGPAQRNGPPAAHPAAPAVSATAAATPTAAPTAPTILRPKIKVLDDSDSP
jgi:hypothetical protein